MPNLNIEVGSTNSKPNLFLHCYKDIIEHSIRQSRISFRFWNEEILHLSHQKTWTTRWWYHTYMKCQPWPTRKLPSVPPLILRSIQVWNSSHQIRSVPQPILIVDMTSLLLKFLQRKLCANKLCSKKLSLYKKIFKSLLQNRLSKSAMRVYVPIAQCSLWKSNKLVYLDLRPGDLHL